MIPLTGQSLPSLPISGLTKVRDLEYFDGPLLSHFKREQGDHFLYYWCDCGENSQRWMVLRVAETSIIRLANRFLPLDQVIPGAAQDDFVYFVDAISGGQTNQVSLVFKADIPEEYLPKPGSYIEPEHSAEDRLYPLLIEGSLSLGELLDIPLRYVQAYSFLYAVTVLKAVQLQAFPWRGGFSSMHFYRGLPNVVPSEHKPTVESIQYASPGFIRFLVHRPTADALGVRIAAFLDRTSPEHRIASQLRAYIAEEKLNDLRDTHPDPKDPEWSKYQTELVSRTRTLLGALQIDDPGSIISALHSPFEAAKITLSFTYRLRNLTGFVREGLIRFPIQ